MGIGTRNATLIPLDRLAQVMQAAPPHFNGASLGAAFPISTESDCVFPQYGWQRFDAVSRDELAEKAATAEQEIAKVLGYPVAPQWIEEELHSYTKFHRVEVSPGIPSILDADQGCINFDGFGADGLYKSIKLDNAYFIAPGRRATTLYANGTQAGGEITFNDTDGDSINEELQIAVAVATEPDNLEEVHLYYGGRSADPRYEIRPLKSVAWAAGTLTIKIWVWQALALAQLEAFPTETAFKAIDATVAANIADSIDVYRVYNDTTQPSVQFEWEGSTTVQTGFLYSKVGSVAKPIPATYSASDGFWTSDAYSVGREPDRVKVWYYAGDCDTMFPGYTLDPVRELWAECVAWMSVARLTRPVCSKGRLKDFAMEMRVDASIRPSDSDQRFLPNDLENPFGPHIGEVMAWRRVMRLNHRVIKARTI